MSGAPEQATPVEVEVLGPLRVLVDGRAVELGPPRRRTLLAALCAAPGQVLSVDTLADRIWDGRPPSSPAATVHAYVSRLRGALRSIDADGTPRASPLRTSAPGYVLDVEPSAIDAHHFADGVARGRELHAVGDPVAARRAVRAALSLWRGPAYADVPAEFARSEADRLSDLRLDASELAVQIDLDLGRHEALLAEIADLLREEPLREGLHASLMLALYRSGRQADALEHFDLVRRRMDDDLGVEPGPDLRRLHQQILRQDDDLAAPPLQVDPLDVGAAAPAEVASGDRVVGRDDELRRLEDALRRGEDGRVVAVAVVGEAGIGKTRLVEEATAAAASRGVQVAWGRCWQHEGAPVMWPWVQALDALLEQVPDGALDAALVGRGAPVRALLPRLALGTAEPTAPELAPVRLYAAVTHVLAELTRERPALIVLEDMHWSDSASRELAEYVVAELGETRLALVLTVRAPHDDVSRAGSELLTALSRSGRGERVVLGGLSPAAVGEYVVSRTGSVLDEATSHALADRTGGNPFFVGELVRLLVTDTHTDLADGTAVAVVPDTVPDSIRDVIARRLERLPGEDLDVLRVAAVVGRTFDLGLLEAVCRLDEDTIDQALDLATERGIICSEPTAPGRHRFVHALTQQTLLDTTGPARVRRLHARVASVVEAGLDPGAEVTAATAEALTFHLSRSGGPDELARAVDLSLAAAEVARRDGNHPEAESLLLRALDLTDRIPTTAGRTREMSVRLQLWSLYCATWGPGAPGAAAQHQRAMDLVEQYGGADELLVAHEAAFARSIFADDLDAVEVLVQEMSAAARADGAHDLQRAAAHLARAQLSAHRGRPEDTLLECAAVEGLDDPLESVPVGIFPITPACSLRIWQALASCLVGDEAAAERALELLAARTLRAGVTTQAYVDVNLAFLHAVRDDSERALRHADAGRELSLRHGFVQATEFVDVIRAWARERLSPGEHLDELVAALARTETMATFALRPSLRGLCADVQLRAGRTDGARASLEAAFAESETTGDVLGLAELHRLQAALLRAEGAAPEAVDRELDRAREVARHQGAELFLRRIDVPSR